MNALSSYLKVKVFRSYEYEMVFQDGVVVQSLTKLEKTNKRGTFVSFQPSPKIFNIPTINPEVIEHNLEELAFLNSNIEISFTNEYKNESKIFHSPNGLLDFI